MDRSSSSIMATLPTDEDKAILTKLLNDDYKYSVAVSNHAQEHPFPTESLIMSLFFRSYVDNLSESALSCTNHLYLYD